MERDRWRRIEALFHEAQRYPLDARNAYLSAACEGDESLLSEVQSLLHDPSRNNLLATAALSPSRVSDASNPHLQPGQRLGKFDLLEVIGSGGMGEVYRARDRQLGRDVAIKVLPPAVAGNPDRLARFDREGRILAALNHPNIATIHGTETSSDQPPAHAIVMELLDGETLAQRLGRVRLRVPDALRLARQIVRALDAAHRKRDRPPRLEAGQYQRNRERRGQGAGFRARHSGPRTTGLRYHGRPRHRGANGHRRPHVRRAGRRHRRVHESRAGARTAGRQADRHLGLRLRSLRGGWRSRPAITC